MKEDVLFVSHVPSMIVAFNIDNIKILQEMGYNVHVACNFLDNSAWTNEQMIRYKNTLLDLGIKLHQIDFPRKPFHPIMILKSYKQFRILIQENNFIMMHNQACTSGVISRCICRNTDIKTIHTEHGFYYFKGGPKRNWLFYPIEKLCAKWTDIFITINSWDYVFAKKHMPAKKIEYIPGIGLDIQKFQNCNVDKDEYRISLNIPCDATVLLSVGELNCNKNHEVVLKAISKLDNPNIHYIIAGEGSKKEYLNNLANDLGLSNRVHLLGFRTDVAQLYHIADLFIFPSFREGLPVSLMEAMACGLPAIVSKIRGNTDLVESGINGYLFNPKSAEELGQLIERIISDPTGMEKMGNCAKKKILQFSKEIVHEKMKKIYKDALQNH